MIWACSAPAIRCTQLRQSSGSGTISNLAQIHIRLIGTAELPFPGLTLLLIEGVYLLLDVLLLLFQLLLFLEELLALLF